MKRLKQIDWSEPSQQQVIISPEDAEYVLEECNEGNRYLRAGGSRYIAKQILNGEWVTNHPQPICFGEDGRLIDGQHRMGGILMSGKTVTANVSFGVPPEYIKYIDTGISRSLSDRVRFHENNSKNRFIGSMINALQIVGRQSPLSEFIKFESRKLTPDEALAIFHPNKHSFKLIAEIRQTKRTLGGATVGLAFVDYHKKYGDNALDMYEELFNPSSTHQNANRLARFLLSSDKRQNMFYPYCVSAFLANEQGRGIKAIRAASWR